MAIYERGDSFYVTPTAQIKTHDCLPSGYYSIERDPQTRGPMLIPRTPFEFPSAIYGNQTEQRCTRILTTFCDRPGKNTGVLMSGVSGTGKSMLMKRVAQAAVSWGIPAIVVDSPVPGPALAGLIGNLGHPVVVVFDEFEKMYSDQYDQENMLAVLDGTTTSQVLFLLTINDLERTTRYIHGRPGRIFYHFQYDGLDAEAIERFLESHSDISWDRRVEIRGVLERSACVTYDILVSITEEVRRYPSMSVDECVADMGIYGTATQLSPVSPPLLRSHSLPPRVFDDGSGEPMRDSW